MSELCIVCGKYPVSNIETGHCEECRKLAFIDDCRAQEERFMQDMGLI
jgi:hypothetical protein